MTDNGIGGSMEKPFDTRDGDSVTVSYNGVKLNIGPFSTVETDSISYTRKLVYGDNVDEEITKIYEYLRSKCLYEAKRKLKEFKEELNVK